MTTDEEIRAREERELAAYMGAYNALSPAEKVVYETLDQMIEGLDDAGVDVSFFPLRARMVVVEYAKRFQLKEGQTQ